MASVKPAGQDGRLERREEVTLQPYDAELLLLERILVFFLKVFNLLPDFFDFQQLYFLFFRHDLKIIPKIAALRARTTAIFAAI